jgi:hypothetical protein
MEKNSIIDLKNSNYEISKCGKTVQEKSCKMCKNLLNNQMSKKK